VLISALGVLDQVALTDVEALRLTLTGLDQRREREPGYGFG
jgi:hypothetical protein